MYLSDRPRRSVAIQEKRCSVASSTTRRSPSGPEERAFWQGILQDPENFERSEIPDDIEIEDGEPTPVEEMLLGRGRH